ncbi:uncharacterized protein LOC114786524 isoform X2 [Denticeps clupeoides]|uniref:C2H2-type domain-containing protein n=1 Tax=Denticeps clupeoides TaxID=299321 RepID=A0AAY4EQG6_9TELE|nr:uncharacterized protein LOC114786524 isoform X2 [Denticeps clupeoides]
MAAFIAHPSVRIKGTEHTYTPVLCQDKSCRPQEKGVHMHCPLCSVSEAYQDPIILRAHYRIKHVDKGIDFAGLKVLRCCNHCEIVGTIKGEKRFKGAHWHCYRCRNGFNRRDEAIKHFKTHFRNPHTTFQIQVTQEVNSRQYYDQSAEAHPKAYSGLSVSLSPCAVGSTFGSILTRPALSPSVTTETLLTVEPKESPMDNGIILGAEEEVGACQNSNQTQTLVVMNPDREMDNLIYEEATSIVSQQGGESLEKQMFELHQQNEILSREKESVERRLKAEIQQLKEQIETLEAQHRELLQTQLAALRREVLHETDSLPINGHTVVLELTLDNENCVRREATEEPPHEEEQTEEKPELQMEDISPSMDIGKVQLDLKSGNESLEPAKLVQESNMSMAGAPSYTDTVPEEQGMSLSQLSRKRASEDEAGTTGKIKVQRFG